MYYKKFKARKSNGDFAGWQRPPSICKTKTKKTMAKFMTGFNVSTKIKPTEVKKIFNSVLCGIQEKFLYYDLLKLWQIVSSQRYCEHWLAWMMQWKYPFFICFVPYNSPCHFIGLTREAEKSSVRPRIWSRAMECTNSSIHKSRSSTHLVRRFS